MKQDKKRESLHGHQLKKYNAKVEKNRRKTEKCQKDILAVRRTFHPGLKSTQLSHVRKDGTVKSAHEILDVVNQLISTLECG